MPPVDDGPAPRQSPEHSPGHSPEDSTEGSQLREAPRPQSEAPAAGRPFGRRPDRHGLIGPFTARQLLAALATVVVVAVLLVAVTTPLAGAPSSTDRPQASATQFVVGQATEGLRPGDLAPDFQVRRSDGSVFQLTDLDGRPIRLADLRGHPVWIDFWASWCPPCQEETPVLRDIYNSYKDRGLVLVAISVQESSAADVQAYAAKYQLPYTVAADLAGDIFRLYRIYGLPTQFFVDANGVIRSVVQGPVDYDLAVANLQGIVPESTGTGTNATPGLSASAMPSPTPSPS